MITPTDLIIEGSVFAPIAIVVTVLRVASSIHKKQFGADAVFAIIATCAYIVLYAAIFIHSRPMDYPSSSLIASNYLSDFGFYTTVWAARLSILLAIVRVVKGSNSRTMNVLYVTAAALVLQYVVLMCQVLWVCVPTQHEWSQIGQCSLGMDVAIAQLITDIISDIALLVIPARLFLSLQIDVDKRARLIAVFGGSILITITSIAHSVAVLQGGGVKEAVLATLECFVAVVVCNVPGLYVATRQIVTRIKSSSSSFLLSRSTQSQIQSPTASDIGKGSNSIRSGDRSSSHGHAHWMETGESKEWMVSSMGNRSLSLAPSTSSSSSFKQGSSPQLNGTGWTTEVTHSSL